VTVAEALATEARVFLMDEISTGLDASVTTDIVRALRARASTEGITCVIALLQPTPET
jgi:ABC-type multidrug transport system ATPase subunit